MRSAREAGSGPEQRGVARSSVSSAWGSAAAGILLLASCAGSERAPQLGAPQVAAASGTTAAVASSAPSAARQTPPPAVTTERAAIAAKPLARPAAPNGSGSAGQGVTRPAAPSPKPADKAASSPSSAAQALKSDGPAAPVAKPAAAPPLDLKSLETRLKDTPAIGVFTKLTLKNQVDDLLDQFRAYYQGRLKTSLADLRRSYDLLVLKVLALLQDADPPLASAIAASRESIWAILSNPAKFAAV